jgi:hypothetical protein
VKQQPRRYRVTKRLSAGHIAILVAALVGILTLAGLAERTLGFGNLLIIFLLVPPIVRSFVAKRTALMITADGVTLDGRWFSWLDIGELVVEERHRSDAIGIRLRHRPPFGESSRRRSEGLLAYGYVQRSRFSASDLEAAFARLAPSTATLTATGRVGRDVERVSGSDAAAAKPPRRAGRSWREVWNVERVAGRDIAQAWIISLVAIAIILGVSGLRRWLAASDEGGAGRVSIQSGGYGADFDVEVTRCEGDPDGLFHLEASGASGTSGDGLLRATVTREPGDEPGEPPLDTIEVVLVNAAAAHPGDPERTDTWIASGHELMEIEDGRVTPVNVDEVATGPLAFHEQNRGSGGYGTFEATCP